MTVATLPTDVFLVEMIELTYLAYHVTFIYFCRYRISFSSFSIKL
jgi:hypothetical protein